MNQTGYYLPEALPVPSVEPKRQSTSDTNEFLDPLIRRL